MTNFELSIYEELKTLSIMAIDAIETVDECTIIKRTLIARHNQFDLRKTPFDEVNAITTKIKKENARQFRNIHSFITCCGNISKLLWFNPNNGEKNYFQQRISTTIRLMK